MGRKSRTRITTEKAVAILRDYQADVPIEQIERRHKVEASTIRKLRARAGIPPRRHKPGPAALPMDEVRRQLGVDKVEEVG
jgi:hypothetical protein